MTDQKTIEQLSDDYRDQWRQSPTTVEDFLKQIPSMRGSASRLTIHLIKHEIELRRSAGEQCSSAEYLKRFPNVDPEVLNNLFSMPAPPPVSVLKPLLPKRYQPIKEIGKGGIGSVWQVDDREMERPLAVKVLHSKLEKDVSANLRLKREAMLTGSLQHPGIPPVFEYGSLVGGSNYFAMKIVEGETLDKVFSKQSQSELLAIFHQVAEAIGFAHSRNVIHRDLKPQNIMVGAFGEVQIMDWGLAKDLNIVSDPQRSNSNPLERTGQPQAEIETGVNSIDSSCVETDSELTRYGDVIGTPAYMSPEQAKGELDSLGPATDVYALGAMLFEILTGNRWDRVRPDRDEPEQVSTILDASLDSDSIAEPLARLCKQCLHPDRDNRPADGSEVAQLVGDYQSQLAQRLKETEIERAKAEAMTDEVRKRSRLRLGMLAAFLLAALMGAGAVAWYQIDQANKRSTLVSDFEIAKERVEHFRDRGDFESAEETVRLIESKTDGFGNEELSRQVAVLKQDNELLKKIDFVRHRRRLAEEDGYGTIVRRSKFVGRTSEYREAITPAIGDIEKDTVESLVARIGQSAIKSHIIAAIDEWAGFEKDAKLRQRLLKVNVAADPDPLRNRIRDEANWTKRDVLFELARSSDPTSMEASTLVLLADKMHALPEPEARIMELTHDEFVRKSVATRESLLLLERSLPWHQDDFWIHMRLASMMEYLELNEDASAHFMAAAAIRSQEGYALSSLAFLKRKLGRYTSAVASMKRAIELDGAHSNNLYYLGNILSSQAQRLGKFSTEAEEAYQKSLELNPDSIMANYNLGTCYANFGRSKEAIPYFRKAVQLDPSYGQARCNLAASLHLINEYKEAEEVLRPLVTNKEGSFQLAHLHYGQNLLALEQFDESKLHLEKALALAEKPRGSKNAIPFLKKSISNCDKFKRVTKQFLESPKDVSSADALNLIEYYMHYDIQEARVAELYKHLLENRIDDLDTSSRKFHRYNAACSAIKINASEGRWPGFAHEQLSKLMDELEAALEALPDDESEREKAGSQLTDFLKHWNGDSDLAPVRDELDKLPENKQRQWTLLWERQATLLNEFKEALD